MKVKVVKKFKDKHTKKIHEVGETFTCTVERYQEILSKGAYVEKVVAKTTVKTKEATE